MSVKNILGSNGKIAAQYLPEVATPTRVFLGDGTGAVSDENTATITIDGETSFDTVEGGLYCIQGTYSLSTGANGYDIYLQVDNAANPASAQIALVTEATSYNAGPLTDVGLPFNCVFIAESTTASMQIQNLGAGAIGNTTNVAIKSAYLVRLA